MRRALALIAILSAIPGCGAMSKDARTAVVMSGIGLTLAGAGVYAEADPEPLSGYDAYGGVYNAIDGDRGTQVLGVLIAIAGAVLFIAGATADEPAPPPPAIAQPPLPVPMPAALAVSPPGQTTPGGALPARPVVGEVRRMALQAQRLAARHQCGAAATLIDRIAVEDAAYASELRGSVVCVATPK